MIGSVTPPVQPLVARPPIVTGLAAERPVARTLRRGLVLDLDDTLYPRERFVYSGLAAVARAAEERYGIEAAAAYALLTRASGNGHAGRELQVLRDRFGLPGEAVAELVEVFRSHTPTLSLTWGVADTLRRLRADGWALAIVTNGLPTVQARKVGALHLLPLVDDVIYAEEHAAGGKPSPAPFRAALQSLGVGPAQCVCVGDDPARDVCGARALGIPTVRLLRPGVVVAPGDEADVVIDSLQQLPTAAALLLRMVAADVA
jgi:putative hydrolase of the HAD superfamily